MGNNMKIVCIHILRIQHSHLNYSSKTSRYLTGVNINNVTCNVLETKLETYSIHFPEKGLKKM